VTGRPAPVGAEDDRPPVPRLTVDAAVQPFWLRAAPARGRLVRLGPLADAILSRHADNPDIVNRILAEALALTAALATALKYEGSFSLQARGDGAVPMLLADCTHDGALRGYARFDADKLAGVGDTPSAARLLGAGYLAFTCDQGPDMDRYQGIVPLEGASLAEITHAYFRASEQTETAVRLFAAHTPAGWRSGALLLRRLFQELSPAHGEPRPLSYGCRCTRARLAGILAGFNDDDLDHMADAEAGRITMTCEFCNHAFRFDRAAFSA
jgi:molecular chaperone Hsp33